MNQALERELDQLNGLWLEEYRTIEDVVDKINHEYLAKLSIAFKMKFIAVDSDFTMYLFQYNQYIIPNMPLIISNIVELIFQKHLTTS